MGRDDASAHALAVAGAARTFITTSSEEIDRLYTPLDIADMEYDHDLGMPGEYPYTARRPLDMYRGRPWTMRMFAGFGTAEETNARFKYLLQHGETGLSTAFDMPTLYGLDTDDHRAARRVWQVRRRRFVAGGYGNPLRRRSRSTRSRRR